MEDSGVPRFQFVDPVAEMLDSAVHSGVLPRELIFYKVVSGALEYVFYDHSKGKKHASQVHISISAVLESLCQADKRCIAPSLVILLQVA